MQGVFVTTWGAGLLIVASAIIVASRPLFLEQQWCYFLFLSTQKTCLLDTLCIYRIQPSGWLLVSVR